MKVFAIRNEEDTQGKDLAYLLYYEFSKKFYIELPDDADFWETPLILSSFIKKGETSINSYWSRIWVEQRIIPADRQNIGLILKENGLDEYDEFKLLIKGKGKCAQDNYYISEIDKEIVEQKFHDRYAKKISDVIPLNNFSLLIFLRNGETIIVNIKSLKQNDRLFKQVLSNTEIFNKVSVLEGGHGVFWGENITISDKELYLSGIDIPLTINDFKSFVEYRIINTSKAAELLNCSRQNINDLVKRGKLNPIKTDQKNFYFLKSEILERLWNKNY